MKKKKKKLFHSGCSSFCVIFFMMNHLKCDHCVSNPSQRWKLHLLLMQIKINYYFFFLLMIVHCPLFASYRRPLSRILIGETEHIETKEVTQTIIDYNHYYALTRVPFNEDSTMEMHRLFFSISVFLDSWNRKSINFQFEIMLIRLSNVSFCGVNIRWNHQNKEKGAAKGLAIACRDETWKKTMRQNIEIRNVHSQFDSNEKLKFVYTFFLLLSAMSVEPHPFSNNRKNEK